VGNATTDCKTEGQQITIVGYNFQGQGLRITVDDTACTSVGLLDHSNDENDPYAGYDLARCYLPGNAVRASRLFTSAHPALPPPPPPFPPRSVANAIGLAEGTGGSLKYVRVEVNGQGNFNQPFLVGYAAPQIDSLQAQLPAPDGCDQGENARALQLCRRDGNPSPLITIIGSNFGKDTPIVFVGQSLCEDVQKVGVAHTMVTCLVPVGFGLDRPVLLLQGLPATSLLRSSSLLCSPLIALLCFA
jgi:hypothetical protein